MLFFALTALCWAEATLSSTGAEAGVEAGAGSACWLTEAEGSRSDRSVLVSSTWGADMVAEDCSFAGAGREDWGCGGKLQE
jgi:hypothetical protein